MSYSNGTGRADYLFFSAAHVDEAVSYDLSCVAIGTVVHHPNHRATNVTNDYEL